MTLITKKTFTPLLLLVCRCGVLQTRRLCLNVKGPVCHVEERLAVTNETDMPYVYHVQGKSHQTPSRSQRPGLGSSAPAGLHGNAEPGLTQVRAPPPSRPDRGPNEAKRFSSFTPNLATPELRRQNT